MTINTDVFSNLPDGWVVASLPVLVAINPRLIHSISDDSVPVTFVPMTAVDVGFGGIQRPEQRTYGEVKKGYTPFTTGDVIFAKITPCMENGKGGVVKGEPDQPFFGSTEFHVLRPRSEVNATWIARYLSKEQFRRSARLKMQGSAGQLRVPTEFLERVSIPLPPSAEQVRILDRIEELFTDLDAGVSALVRVQKKLKRYRAALLHAAVTGRLTADWRAKHGDGGESGQQLLERILVARRQDWEERTLAEYKAKDKAPPKDWRDRYVEPRESNSLKGIVIPESWSWSNTDQLMSIITSGSRDWSPFYDRGTGTFIMAGNVRMGKLDLAKRQAVDPPPDHRDRKRSQVEPNDLLVTIVGANTGDVCRVGEPLPDHFVCQSVALMRPVEDATSRWMEIWFTSDSGAQDQFRKVMYGAGRPHLSFDQLESTSIPLPPAKEQVEIAEVVEVRISEIDAMQAEVGRSLRRAARLKQAILKAAFEGKLVPQSAEDEPASELLARIQAEADAEFMAVPKRSSSKRKAANKRSRKKAST